MPPRFRSAPLFFLERANYFPAPPTLATENRIASERPPTNSKLHETRVPARSVPGEGGEGVRTATRTVATSSTSIEPCRPCLCLFLFLFFCSSTPQAPPGPRRAPQPPDRRYRPRRQRPPPPRRAAHRSQPSEARRTGGRCHREALPRDLRRQRSLGHNARQRAAGRLPGVFAAPGTAQRARRRDTGGDRADACQRDRQGSVPLFLFFGSGLSCPSARNMPRHPRRRLRKRPRLLPPPNETHWAWNKQGTSGGGFLEGGPGGGR